MDKLGYVVWFNNGEGEIYCLEDKKYYYVHYSAIIEGEKSRKNLEKHAPVEFSLYTNLYMSQVDKVRQLGDSVRDQKLVNDIANQVHEMDVTTDEQKQELTIRLWAQALSKKE